MAETQQQPPVAAPAQFTPRFRTDVYPFIEPAKFRGSLQDKVAIITGTNEASFSLLPVPPLGPCNPAT